MGSVLGFAADEPAGVGVVGADFADPPVAGVGAEFLLDLGGLGVEVLAEADVQLRDGLGGTLDVQGDDAGLRRLGGVVGAADADDAGPEGLAGGAARWSKARSWAAFISR
jgi:hypothetical protein